MNALFDLCRVNTPTTGTGTLTLGTPVAGFLSFAQAGVPDGAVVSYGIADGASSEVGSGTYSAGAGTLTRSVYRSTGAGNTAAINLSGAAQVFVTALKADFESLRASSGGSMAGDWSWNDGTEPPGSGQVRIDAASSLGAMTKLWISYTTAPGTDATQFLKKLVTTGTILYVQDKDNSTRWLELQVTGAVVDKTTYGEWPVTKLNDSGVALPHQQRVWLAVQATGTAADITAVNAGTGLSGGGTTGDVTLSLASPVAIANGGTNATSASAALTSLGAYPASNPSGYVTGGPYLALTGGVLSGNLSAPNYSSSGYVDGQLFYMGGVALITKNATTYSFMHRDGTHFAMQAVSNVNVVYNGDAHVWNKVDASTNIGYLDATMFQITGATAYKPGGGSWTAPSDWRLKDAASIVDYGRGLSAVMQLRPIYYQYNGKAATPTGETFVGLVADEVEPIMPEMVGTRLVKLEPDDEVETAVKTLDCTALLFALVNCVKELRAEIDALKAGTP